MYLFGKFLSGVYNYWNISYLPYSLEEFSASLLEFMIIILFSLLIIFGKLFVLILQNMNT